MGNPNCNLEVVRALLDSDKVKMASSKNADGYTALYYAVHYGHLEAVRMLLDSDKFTADATNAQMFDSKTALHFAAEEGQLEIVRALLNSVKFTAINTKNKCGKTAIELAVSKRHTGIADGINKFANPRINQLH